MVLGDLSVAAAREAQAAMERAAAAEGRMQRRTVAAVPEGLRRVDKPARPEPPKRAEPDRGELVELAVLAVPEMGALAAIASVKNASSAKMLAA